MDKVVWVVNQSYRHDYSGAGKFGRMEELTHGTVDVFSGQALGRSLETKLSRVTEEDFLLICGHTILNIAIVLELFKRLKSVNLLVYGAKYKDYRVVKWTNPFSPYSRNSKNL